MDFVSSLLLLDGPGKLINKFIIIQNIIFGIKIEMNLKSSQDKDIKQTLQYHKQYHKINNDTSSSFLSHIKMTERATTAWLFMTISFNPRVLFLFKESLFMKLELSIKVLQTTSPLKSKIEKKNSLILISLIDFYFFN